MYPDCANDLIFRQTGCTQSGQKPGMVALTPWSAGQGWRWQLGHSSWDIPGIALQILLKLSQSFIESETVFWNIFWKANPPKQFGLLILQNFNSLKNKPDQPCLVSTETVSKCHLLFQKLCRINILKKNYGSLCQEGWTCLTYPFLQASKAETLCWV